MYHRRNFFDSQIFNGIDVSSKLGILNFYSWIDLKKNFLTLLKRTSTSFESGNPPYNSPTLPSFRRPGVRDRDIDSPNNQEEYKETQNARIGLVPRPFPDMHNLFQPSIITTENGVRLNIHTLIYFPILSERVGGSSSVIPKTVLVLSPLPSPFVLSTL